MLNISSIKEIKTKLTPMSSSVLCDKGLDVSLGVTMTGEVRAGTFLTNKMLRHWMIILTSKKNKKEP